MKPIYIIFIFIFIRLRLPDIDNRQSSTTSTTGADESLSTLSTLSIVDTARIAGPSCPSRARVLRHSFFGLWVVSQHSERAVHFNESTFIRGFCGGYGS